MRSVGLDRFIVGTRVAKRIFFCWADPSWRPSDSTNVFALASPYSIALLTSSVHTEWARARSSTLEDRIRYTPSSAFETFPWPNVDEEGVNSIGAAGEAVLQRRSEICRENEIGLTTLYNQRDEGAWEDLTALHRALDVAVLTAYEWSDLDPADSPSVNQRLYELNAAIVRGDIHYSPRFE